MVEKIVRYPLAGYDEGETITLQMHRDTRIFYVGFDDSCSCLQMWTIEKVEADPQFVSRNFLSLVDGEKLPNKQGQDQVYIGSAGKDFTYHIFELVTATE